MAHRGPPIGAAFGLIAAASSAVLLFVAGEPLGIGTLGWIALVPLLVAVLRARSAPWSWLYGLAFGLVYFGAHLSWIFLFGWMAWTALTLVLALYGSVGTLIAFVLRRGPFAPVLVAGAWVGAELLRDRWPFGGYSWGSVGTTQGSVPGVRWLAGVIGVYGLTFLAVFVSALIAARIVHRRIDVRSIIAVGGVLLAFVVADLALYGRPPDGEPVTMAVVQGGMVRPAGRPGLRDDVFDSHMRITRGLLQREDVDIVVWPEDALGVGVHSEAFAQVQAVARKESTPFIIGQSVIADPGERFLNLVRYIDPSGELKGTYQKRHPVPFGEYVPLSFFRRFVGTLQSEVPLDLEPGTDVSIFDVGGTKIATPICFESVFPRDILDFGRKGAELYVLSTNNSSFERSYASQQHIAHTRMRALETRQWIVQAALAGISASIAPDGKISHATGLFTAEGFVTDVRARGASSLYARMGDLFGAIFAGLSGAAAAVHVVRRRRHTMSDGAKEAVEGEDRDRF